MAGRSKKISSKIKKNKPKQLVRVRLSKTETRQLHTVSAHGSSYLTTKLHTLAKLKLRWSSLFSSIVPSKRRGRGRPKKYHTWYFLTHWSSARQQLEQSLLHFFRIHRETRGRKKLPFKVRWQRWLEVRRQQKIQASLEKQRRAKKFHDKALRLLRLKRRRGRPRKHEVSWRVVLLGVGHSTLSVAQFTRSYKQVLTSLFFSVAFVAITFSGFVYFFADLPAASDLTAKDQALTTKIMDRNGQILYRVYADENRTLVPLHQISPYAIQATIAIEDKDFYKHIGFSITGITRAFFKNVSGETIEQGGSTITQQLVKNRLLSSERTIKRKVRELVLSLIVEGMYDKNEILGMYLNQVPYGGSTYGIEEAAWRYFNKSAKELSLAESALLAGLPAAPSAYTPFGPNPDLAFARQAEVLRRMVEDEYITAEQAREALQQKLVFNNTAIDIKAPHFVMYVRQLLAEQFGEEVLTKGGLEVRTTLDLDLQQQTQEILTKEVNKLKPLRISNGAALITNPKTGEILSMIGSKDYFDFARDGQVNVVVRERQPGSSIKPLTYAIAMDQLGKTPASVILDAPITYAIAGSKPYAPRNYDGKFHGSVTLRESLASSYNIPAVKMLAEIGVSNFIDSAEEMGISTWKDRNRFGLSLTLGGGEVKMIDLAQAYSVFATQGYAVEPTAILEVRNQKSELLYRNDCALQGQLCSQKPVLSPTVAYLISNILSDNQARTPAFGPHSVLFIPNQEVAVKTGTTNSLRDNWTIGYTSDRLVAVWVGNNDNTPMSYVASGITGASPIWNSMMRLLLDEKAPHTFALPTGLVKVAICTKTGTLPCTGCPQVRQEVFAVGTQPTRSCSPVVFQNPPAPVQ